MRRILAVLLFIGIWAKGLASALQPLDVPFYNTAVTIHYDKKLLNWRQYDWDDRSLQQSFRGLTQARAIALLESLLQVKERFLLNDWLFYQLTCAATKRVLEHRSKAEMELLTWFLLTEAGFDTRLARRDERLFVYAATKDEIFEAPLIEDAQKTFVNLTALREKQKNPGAVRLVPIGLPKGDRSFSFQLQILPLLPVQKLERQIAFTCGKETHQLQVEIDQTLVKWLREYPRIQESAYFLAPMSTALRASLLPQLQALIKGKAPVETLELLVQFTRSAFRYDEDEPHFGSNKPMIPEEVFFYPFSDCEDRSALLYALIRELMIIPAIVVAYPNHITVAVAMPNLGPDFLLHQGRRYYICDPTSPPGAPIFGIPSSDLRGKPFEVILQHK